MSRHFPAHSRIELALRTGKSTIRARPAGAAFFLPVPFPAIYAGRFGGRPGVTMKRMTELFNAARNAARRLPADERGGEILEYVLIAGLVIVATIAVIASVGTNVLARWTSVSNSSL